MYFNSHAHVERDVWCLVFGVWSIPHFNSHAHVERDQFYSQMKTADKNFNSHAHVERDFLPKYFFINLDISTHTLTWSVTG